jgi:hypothetical protein
MSGGASFETRPCGTLLRMRTSPCCTKKGPHAEEGAKRPSRSMAQWKKKGRGQSEPLRPRRPRPSWEAQQGRDSGLHGSGWSSHDRQPRPAGIVLAMRPRILFLPTNADEIGEPGKRAAARRLRIREASGIGRPAATVTRVLAAEMQIEHPIHRTPHNRGTATKQKPAAAFAGRAPAL